eukprot:XP_016661117.1 PREDICTED: uncharacterized protein LOC107884125 [Acyrthosiphon pisum]
MKVGFSDEFGFLNYCFAEQFLDILLAFFEDSRSYLNAADDLYDPATFCKKHINTENVKDYVTKKHVWNCVLCCSKIEVELERREKKRIEYQGLSQDEELSM